MRLIGAAHPEGGAPLGFGVAPFDRDAARGTDSESPDASWTLTPRPGAAPA